MLIFALLTICVLLALSLLLFIIATPGNIHQDLEKLSNYIYKHTGRPRRRLTGYGDYIIHNIAKRILDIEHFIHKR